MDNATIAEKLASVSDDLLGELELEMKRREKIRLEDIAADRQKVWQDDKARVAALAEREAERVAEERLVGSEAKARAEARNHRTPFLWIVHEIDRIKSELEKLSAARGGA